MRLFGLALGALALAALLVPVEASAHGWHRSCHHGLTDVHRHVKGIGRVECTTRRCYTNRFGFKRCKWS